MSSLDLLTVTCFGLALLAAVHNRLSRKAKP